jgi:methionyl-tRNA synthetase
MFNIYGGNNQILFIVLMIWSMVWKGLALWRAAKRDDKVWYIIFLVVNLVGIPEIIYLLVTNKKKEASK